MKKLFAILFIISIIFNIVMILFAGITYYNSRKKKDIFRLNRFEYANSQVANLSFDDNKVVFIGNSIIEGWINFRYRYFLDNQYLCRGIGGQTTPLLLLRFRSDVIDLKPKAVVIGGGTNDIRGNTGDYDPVFTMNNIKSMAQLAEVNGIKVILCSLLPHEGVPWLENNRIPDQIIDLNKEIEAYAKENNYVYVDYYPHMVNDKKGLKWEYTMDGLHPNEEGYIVMESIINPIIKEVINK